MGMKQQRSNAVFLNLRAMAHTEEISTGHSLVLLQLSTFCKINL